MLARTLTALTAFFLALLAVFGSQAVTSYAEDVTVSGTVNPTVDPDQSSVSATPLTVVANNTAFSTVTVTLRDQNGAELSGITVTLSTNRTADNIDCDIDNTSNAPSSAVTDSSGQVRCRITSQLAGSSTVTAVANSLTLNDHPVITFTEPGGGGGTITPPATPPTDPGTPAVPSEPGQTPIEVPSEPAPGSFIDRLNDILETINRTVGPALSTGLGLLVIIPSLALLTPVTTGILFSIMSGLPVLQYLLYRLFPWLRAPRKWGVVRDKDSHVPLPGIFVLLMEHKSGREVKRIMTDKTGRFGFLPPKAGTYVIRIQNPLYETYHSHLITLTSRDSTPISFDIFLAAKERIRSHSLRRAARFLASIKVIGALQLITLLVGSALALSWVLENPTAQSWLLVGLYFVLWVGRLAIDHRNLRFGLVRAVDGLTLPSTVIQVTSRSHGEQSFLHSTITDEKGRFLILVPPGQHTIIAAKEGYASTEKNISGEAEGTILTLTPLGAV